MFIEMLIRESWDNVISHTDIVESFNSYLNTFLIIFESCSPMQYVTNNVSNNHWITTGIKSCKRKTFLYIMSNNNRFKIKVLYIRYCIVLRN